MVAPGSAQLIAGSRRFGAVVLSIWATLLIGGGLVLWQVPMDSLARLAVQPWILTSFRVAAFVLAAGWVLVVLDAWRLGRPPTLARRHRLVMVAVTLVVASLVSTPFVYAARYATAAHDAVVGLFPSGTVAAASDGRLNFLVIGADAGEGRAGVRPDSLNLVSVDVRTGSPVMISLPRNLQNARFEPGTPAANAFPAGFAGGPEEDLGEYLLNATWTYAEANPELFPGPSGPGPTAVMQAVSGTLGIPVHNYIAVDMMGFRELVDALGGVSIDVGEEVPIGEKGRVLEPGLQTLTGYEALWYARSREGSSDYARMARQRCVIDAIVQQADPQTMLTNFTDLASASQSMLETDIPREQLPDLVELALQARQSDITSLQLVPPLITPGDPDFDVIADEVAAVLKADTTTPDATAAAPAPDTVVDDDATGVAVEPAALEGAAGDDVAATAADETGDSVPAAAPAAAAGAGSDDGAPEGDAADAPDADPSGGSDAPLGALSSVCSAG